MRLAIRARGLELDEALRDHVMRRIYFALSRLSHALGRVDVTVADVNGPRGGIDKVCRVRVRGPGLAEIVVEERDEEITVAVDRAANRSARSVHRAIELRRSA